METKINLEVHLLTPNWVFQEGKPSIMDVDNTRYRIYVNDDLITERTWIWGNNTFIDENILINVKGGEENTIKFEPVLSGPVGKFLLKNLRINDIMKETDEESNELTFKINKYKIPRKIEHEALRIYQRRV